MRYVSWWLAGTALLTTLGCAGGGSSPLAPASPTAGNTPNPVASLSATGSLGSPMLTGDLSTAALAIYTLQIDPATLQATSSLKQTRSVQANDDIYLLSIDSFLNANSFKVTGITAAVDTIDIGYQVTHPFPAPSDPTGAPNGSTNRADLGIGGMVLFLADVPSATGNTYFTDKVANTELVANADAYYEPGGLLSVTGNANTFPYRQLVDERSDSRVGVSNSGDVTGNFGVDGWTRSEFGTGNNGWTGYGTLHQGQSSSGTLSLNLAALGGGFSLDVAIIAKYGDPRGGTTGAQKKANRLPPAAADSSLFAYRGPHNALDGASIAFEGESGGFTPNTISASTLSFHVVDWDARATETSAADLSADTAFDTVAVGESGTPTVEVCIPGVLGDATFVSAAIPVVDDDSAAGGDAAADDGLPGDELYYSALITKAAGTGQTAGNKTGMARVTDPEVGLTIGLDEALAPLPTAPEPVTYQAFSILSNNVPTATVALTSADPMNSGTGAAVSVTAMADLDGDNLDVLVDWGDGGGFVTVASGLVGPAYPNQTPTGPTMNNLDLVTDAISMTVRVTDGTSNVDFPLGYTLGANRAPVVGGAPVLATASLPPPATFTMNAGTATAVDPEGDTISYLITAGTTPNGPFPSAAGQAALPIPSLGPYPVPGVIAFTVHARDTLHGNTTPAQPDSTSTYAVVNGTVIVPCPGLVLGGTAITGAYGSSGVYITSLGGVAPTCDIDAFTKTTFSIYGGSVFQNCTAASRDFVMQLPTNATTGSGASFFTVLNTTAAGLLSMRARQIETDGSAPTNRIVFSTTGTAVPYAAGTYGTPAQYYTAGTGANTGFSWFDYSGAAVTAVNNVSTGTSQVIAMEVDTAGNVLIIDQNHVMHRYLRASAYAEDTTTPYPLNLLPIIGSPSGVGDANRKIGDFIFNDYNKNFFILMQTQGVATAPGNGLVYRIECDGVYNPTVAGNPNPFRFIVNPSITQSNPLDIEIDQRNTTGALLGAQAERQIMISSPGSTTFQRMIMNASLSPVVTNFLYNGFGYDANSITHLSNHFAFTYTGIASPPYMALSGSNGLPPATGWL